MPLAPNSHLGPYLVLAPLGTGGMGEVYRARDTRLQREVAIKVLPAAVVDAPDRRARFEREARAVAALDHPHICGIYDVGEAQGTHYLVMPLLEGQTLAARVAAGPLPIDDVLRIARQIAGALAEAHRVGIVHRDLKPANVMLTKSGVKLLDFGLAKLRAPGGAIVAETGTAPGAATTTAGTAAGTILGTIHYMAPEQVEGHEADHRADVWALGVVLYEMTTGLRPFAGASAASVVGAILKDVPPPVSSRRALSPPALDHLVATCLQKAADDRWQSCRDVMHALDGVQMPAVGVGDAPAGNRGGPGWLLPVAAAAALAVGVLLGRGQGAPATPPARDVRFTVLPEPGTSLYALTGSVVAPSVTISPDGRYLAFPAVTEGRAQLWLRDLRSTTSRLLAGTEDIRYHFWSPDSRSIGFTARGKLKTVGLDGALPVDRATINRTARGGTWLRDGTIVVNRSPDSGLFRASADGALAPVFPGGGSDGVPVDLFPYALADGAHMLFVHRSRDEQQRGLYLATVDGRERTRLVPGAWGPVALDDTLFYLRGQTLVAQRLDLSTRRLTGEPVVVLDRVANSTGGYMSASISNTGTLAYAEPWPTTGELGWFTRDGTAVGPPIAPAADYVDLSLSPANDVVAFSRIDGQSTMGDVWLLDLARGVTTRFTSDPQHDAGSTWTADGRHLLFRSNRRGTNELFVKDVDAARPETPLVEHAQGPLALVVHGEYAQGGTHLVLTSAGESMDVLDVDVKSGAARPIASSPFDEYHTALSPDGRWLAFVSEETGAPEVYVQAYPGGNQRMQVSASGGSEPQWSRDGRELFYLRGDRMLMAVPVRAATALSLGTPQVLFQTRVPVTANAYRRQYVAASDGRRFLINNAPATARQPAIHVVLDWRALLADPPR